MDRSSDTRLEDWRFEPNVWVWCSRCEQAYQADDVHFYSRPDEQGFTCPYEGCEGDYIAEGYNYSNLRSEQRLSWPEVPERGVKYSLDK